MKVVLLGSNEQEVPSFRIHKYPYECEIIEKIIVSLQSQTKY